MNKRLLVLVAMMSVCSINVMGASVDVGTETISVGTPSAGQPFAGTTISALCQMLGYSPYESSLAPIICMVGAILFAQK